MRRLITVATAAVSAVAIGTPAAAARMTATSPVSRSHATGQTDTTLAAVAATSKTNAWAVGGRGVNGSGANTLIEHWNGRAWVVQRCPNPAKNASYLSAVAAISPRQAWAVGVSRLKTLIEHWNGRAWRVQTSPNPVAGDDLLTSVAAVSSTDVWAVGYTIGLSGSEQALIEHWNGHRWRVQATPHVNNWTTLNAVTATSASNAWAVGTNLSPSVPSSVALIEHWNGHSWRVHFGPHPGNYLNGLLGVDARPGRGAWAVGNYVTTIPGYADQLPLIEHWNGRAWRMQPNPKQVGGEYVPEAVDVLSRHSVWLAGWRTFYGAPRTLIEYWNGREWKVQSSPDLALGDLDANYLYGISATSTSNAWAVGSYRFNGSGQIKTLIEHWNGRKWARQHSPSPT